MLFVVKVGTFRIQQELFKPKSNLIPFKSYNKPKSLFKRLVEVVSCQLFQEMLLKLRSFGITFPVLLNPVPQYLNLKEI